MTIIKFPEEKTLLDRMQGMCNDIEYMYNSLQRTYEIQEKIEDQVGNLEDEFNALLKRYVEMVGVDNVPVRFLEFSTNVEVRIDEEGNFQILYIGEEDEQPSSEA